MLFLMQMCRRATCDEAEKLEVDGVCRRRHLCFLYYELQLFSHMSERVDQVNRLVPQIGQILIFQMNLPYTHTSSQTGSRSNIL